MTTTAPTVYSRRVKHKLGCSHPPLTPTAKAGGQWRFTCGECGRYVTIHPGENSPYLLLIAPRTPRPATTPPTFKPPVVKAPPPPPAHGYACRPHYRPVNWRGNGCPQCDRERRDAARHHPPGRHPMTTTTTTQGER